MTQTHWTLTPETLDDYIALGRVNGDFHCSSCGQAYVDAAEMFEAYRNNGRCYECQDFWVDQIRNDVMEDGMRDELNSIYGE